MDFMPQGIPSYPGSEPRQGFPGNGMPPTDATAASPFPEVASPYPEADRLIYQSPFPGLGPYDPLTVRRRLFLHSKGKIREYQEKRGSKDDLEWAEGEEGAVSTARKAFSTPDDVPDAIVLALLDHFLVWLEGKEPAAGNWQTSQPPMGSSPEGETVCPTNFTLP